MFVVAVSLRVMYCHTDAVLLIVLIVLGNMSNSCS
jgi:hypothetical protein